MAGVCAFVSEKCEYSGVKALMRWHFHRGMLRTFRYEGAHALVLPRPAARRFLTLRAAGQQLRVITDQSR